MLWYSIYCAHANGRAMQVQAVEWSTEESYVLLTGKEASDPVASSASPMRPSHFYTFWFWFLFLVGGFDQKVHLADARQGDQASTVHW